MARSRHCRVWPGMVCLAAAAANPSMNYNWLFGPSMCPTTMRTSLVQQQQRLGLQQQQPQQGDQLPQEDQLQQGEQQRQQQQWHPHCSLCTRINWSYFRKWILKRKILIISLMSWRQRASPARPQRDHNGPQPHRVAPLTPFVYWRTTMCGIPMAPRNTSKRTFSSLSFP